MYPDYDVTMLGVFESFSDRLSAVFGWFSIHLGSLLHRFAWFPHRFALFFWRRRRAIVFVVAVVVAVVFAVVAVVAVVVTVDMALWTDRRLSGSGECLATTSDSGQLCDGCSSPRILEWPSKGVPFLYGRYYFVFRQKQKTRTIFSTILRIFSTFSRSRIFVSIARFSMQI